MKPRFHLDTASTVPVYKQLISNVQQLIAEGALNPGDILPSMNELSTSLDISKETVKKAYAILREKGIIESAQGKGFYVLANENGQRTKVLMLFDKLSTYKFILYSSFVENVGENVNVTIHLHNQEIDLFETFLEENLGQFDYYIITAHFPLDEETTQRLEKLLKRIPNRKLILLDRNIDRLQGNFGSVYQDFESDVAGGLQQAIPFLKKYRRLKVVASAGSLYGKLISKGIRQFCEANNLEYAFLTHLSPSDIRKGDVYVVLNGQLDIELIELIRGAKTQNLRIGDEIGIISYNESPLNEIILDGLTVLSTDFKEMGRRAAEMVKTGKLSKIANPFGLIVRQTL